MRTSPLWLPLGMASTEDHSRAGKVYFTLIEDKASAATHKSNSHIAEAEGSIGARIVVVVDPLYLKSLPSPLSVHLIFH